MAIEFRNVSGAGLQGLSVYASDGAVIGVVGDGSAVVRLAGDVERPSAGQVLARGQRRYLGLGDALDFGRANVVAIDHAFAAADPLARTQALVQLDALRSSGATILIASHEPAFLRQVSDEVWWLENGRLAGRGDPGEVLDRFLGSVAAKLRAWGETLVPELMPAMRKGDGRAEISELQAIGSSGRPTAVLASGEEAIIRVVVRFLERVDNPVIGIMIRTRIGLEVYGTNTELERVKLGPCAAGEVLQIEFRFRCELCPKEYTLTAASHDPDGTAHDWVDDAVSFKVTDSRSTAGVANLRARVDVKKVSA